MRKLCIYYIRHGFLTLLLFLQNYFNLSPHNETAKNPLIRGSPARKFTFMTTLVPGTKVVIKNRTGGIPVLREWGEVIKPILNPALVL